eukprot:3460320-Prymnesium_polylepis.1
MCFAVRSTSAVALASSTLTTYSAAWEPAMPVAFDGASEITEEELNVRQTPGPVIVVMPKVKDRFGPRAHR